MAGRINYPVSALLAFLLAACGGDPEAQATDPGPAREVNMAKIEGEVSYRERIMISPDSLVEVQLEDISRADALATVVHEVSFKAGGGPPYPFSIDYDPAQIDDRMRYALRARIISPEGDLLFTNTEYIDPFSGNPVRVLVNSVARPAMPEPAAGAEPGDEADDAIVWTLVTLEGEAAPGGAGGKPADLQLDAAARTVAGFSGCNRYTGSFSSEGSAAAGTPMKFGPLAGTMMACPDGGELEQAYLQALARVDAYRMHGSELELLSDGEVVATFRPR